MGRWQGVISRQKMKRPLHQEELEGGAGASSKLEQGLNNIIVAMSEVSRKKDLCSLSALHLKMTL